MKRVLFACALLLMGADDDAMGRRVQELLRAHQDDVYACVQKSPAAGELLVRVMVGPDQRPAKADVLKGEPASLGKCIVDKVRGWDLSPLGASAGDQVVFPLAFRPDANANANAYLVPAQKTEGTGKVRPRAILAGKASLSLVTLAPTVRLGVHHHTSGEAVYVVRGILRVRQPGQPQVSLKAGDAAWFKPGEPHSLEAAPLAPAAFVQVFDPAGPERAYADPKAPGTAPSGPARVAAPAFVAQGQASPPLKILGGKGSVKLLLDGSGAGVALEEIAAETGAQVPPHKHDASDEPLYILAGRGTTTIAGKSFTVAAGDAVRIPAGLDHALTVDEKLIAVQVYAPAGPEQRFKK